MSRGKGVTKDNVTDIKKTFCETLSKTYSVLHACKAVGISRNTAYRWRADDEDFASDWKEALADAADMLEASVFQRALNAEDKNAHLLAMFVLKGAMPEKYAERTKQELSGPGGGPVEVAHSGALAGMSDEELARLAGGGTE